MFFVLAYVVIFAVVAFLAILPFALLVGIFTRLGDIRHLLRLAHRAYLLQAGIAAPPAPQTAIAPMSPGLRAGLTIAVTTAVLGAILLAAIHA